jgi:predicted DNA-binding transcriptional regulator YafY
MRYHSFSSEREKAYTVEPSRLVFAQGALYLMAYVPEYSQVRTFAVDRIKSLSVTEERFEPVESDEAVFAHSLGVHHGTPEQVEIVFEPRIAPYLRERMWHSSQTVRDEPDGRITVTLNVSNDFALRTWILGFGALAKVIAPAALADEIEEEASRMVKRYRE